MDRTELAFRLGAKGRSTEPGGPLVIEAANPADFQSAFVSAVAGSGPVFLVDPKWGPVDRGALAEAIRVGDSSPRKGWLMIPTSGSTGSIRFARHDEQTLWAAVQGYCGRFGNAPARAVGVLSLHHVSGLMAWMRCALTGGEYVPWDWKQLEAGAAPTIASAEEWSISLVPTQLQRLMEVPAALQWLRRLGMIFVGGGAAWPDLLDRAAKAGLPISTCYGMTETAAMVTALNPDRFAAGIRSCGPALPHAYVAIDPTGRVRVSGASLFRGYWPDLRDEGSLETSDLGSIDSKGHLRVSGRADFVINSGGQKVNPLALEDALRATGEFEDVAVIGVPDSKWGEIVVVCYPATGSRPDPVRASYALRDFPSYARPKRYAAIANWSRNEQGKLDRAALLAQLRAR